MTKKPSVALIGAGSMGGALLVSWAEQAAIDFSRSAIFDPAASERVKKLCARYKISLNPPIDAVDADVMIVAIKPQKAQALLPEYSPIAMSAIVVSVMAGKSIASVSTLLGNAKRVARSMPNLPAAIGQGMSGIYAPNSIDADGRGIIEGLMKTAGDVVWVKNEKEIDFVTAISGSGPAYYFLLTEALADAGDALGLDREAAAKLALATLTGAGGLMAVETRTSEEMRRAVTSPGGTTEAALHVFDGAEQRMRKLVADAVLAAAKRAGELTD